MNTHLDTVTPHATVLLVDDDSALRNALEFALQVEGFDVRTYASGSELLADPDLPRHGCLIVDHRMPDMTGLEVVESLRERRISLPTILITTHPSAGLRRHAARAGIALIEKPLLGDALFQGIRAALVRGA
jgi:FixJ family two-component response regulator